MLDGHLDFLSLKAGSGRPEDKPRGPRGPDGQPAPSFLEAARRTRPPVNAVIADITARREDDDGSSPRPRPAQVPRWPKHAEGLLRQVLLRGVVPPARPHHRAAAGAPARPATAPAAAAGGAARAGGAAGGAAGAGAHAGGRSPERGRGPGVLLMIS